MEIHHVIAFADGGLLRSTTCSYAAAPTMLTSRGSIVDRCSCGNARLSMDSVQDRGAAFLRGRSSVKPWSSSDS